jgi:predicted nucleotidyltransferase component of viral defense system
MYFYSLEKTRPTKDIDFLGINIPFEKSFVESVLRQICSISFPSDAVNFDVGSITSEEISEQDKYPGIRLFVTANLDTIRQRLQVDVGFGDIVFPAPVQLNYPTFFPESGTPVILAYSLETVVAEKFEAMIDLSSANSRMKDYYDVYQILLNQQLNSDHLAEAIKATFVNRKTRFTPDHSLFSPAFYMDANRLLQWKAFLRKNHLDLNIEFPSIMEIIVNSLFPIWESLK